MGKPNNDQEQEEVKPNNDQEEQEEVNPNNNQEEQEEVNPNNNNQEEKEEESGVRLITQEELSKHNSYDDCWFVIHGKVYDVTSFMDDHPGGDEVLKDVAGDDGTQGYDDTGHSENADEMLKDLYIGEYVAPKEPEKSNNQK